MIRFCSVYTVLSAFWILKIKFIVNFLFDFQLRTWEKSTKKKKKILNHSYLALKSYLRYLTIQQVAFFYLTSGDKIVNSIDLLSVVKDLIIWLEGTFELLVPLKFCCISSNMYTWACNQYIQLHACINFNSLRLHSVQQFIVSLGPGRELKERGRQAGFKWMYASYTTGRSQKRRTKEGRLFHYSAPAEVGMWSQHCQSELQNTDGKSGFLSAFSQFLHLGSTYKIKSSKQNMSMCTDLAYGPCFMTFGIYWHITFSNKDNHEHFSMTLNNLLMHHFNGYVIFSFVAIL